MADMEAEEAAGTFVVMLDKVSFVSKLNLLNKATADDESPTPGYMYKEINNLTLDSGSYCQALLDYLVERIYKPSCHVKLKVLRIMAFVVQNGHPDFRQGLRRQARGIKEASVYNGPPDPLHGNAPNLMVRKAAKDLLQVLFDVGTDDDQLPNPEPVVSVNTGGMGNITTSGKMQGFGNTANKPKSLGQSILSGIQEFVDKVVDPQPNARASAVSGADRYFGEYQPAEMTRAAGSPGSSPRSDKRKAQQVPLAKQVATRRVTKSHKKGVAGGGWEDTEAECSDTRTGSSCKSAGSSDLSDKLESVRIADWTTEIQLVKEAVGETNSAMPSKMELATFIKRCSGLNCDKVLELLNEKLETHVGQPCNQLRALLFLESILRSDLMSVDHIALVCSCNLIQLYQQEQGPVQAKARKILRQLEKLSKHTGLFKEVAVQNHSSPKQQQTKPEPVSRLVDISPLEASTGSNSGLWDCDQEGDAENLRALHAPFADQSSHILNDSRQLKPNLSILTTQDSLENLQEGTDDVKGSSVFNGQRNSQDVGKTTSDLMHLASQLETPEKEDDPLTHLASSPPIITQQSAFSFLNKATDRVLQSHIQGTECKKRKTPSCGSYESYMSSDSKDVSESHTKSLTSSSDSASAFPSNTT